MSIGYIANKGITTKVFEHQNEYYTSLYKNYKGREILVHTIKVLAKEVENHPILLERVSDRCLLCFNYQERKNIYNAYFEELLVDDDRAKHIKLEESTGHSLIEALDKLERKISKGRIKKYE